jgi:protein O-GlcNAc transferase
MSSPAINPKKRQKLDALMQRAVTAHQAGDLAAAARGYQKALKEVPRFPDALHLLGLVKYQGGEREAAVELIRQALRHGGDNPLFYFNLGKVEKDRGQLAAAVQAFQQALRLQPHYSQAAANLGSAYQAMGCLDEAIAQFETALRLNPNDVFACNNLGTAYRQRGKRQQAEACYRRAIELQPRYAEPHSNLGVLAREGGDLAASEELCRHALELDASQPELWTHLGITLNKRGRYEEANDCFRRALDLDPRCASALAGLGNTLREQGRLDEAVEWLTQGEAARGFDNAYRGCLLFTLNYNPRVSREESLRHHRRYGEALQAHLAELGWQTPSHDNSRDPGRRLKLGFVSPDFRTHSCAYFLLPLLTALDRTAFEVSCYSEVARPDEVTARFRGLADQWLDTVGLSDRELAQRIRDDGIDILIDLAGHTEGNRLPVFGMKPAPLQLNWLGYPNTTGVAAMDYRLTDGVADPVGDSDAYHTERLLRLPESFLCFQPLTPMPPVSPLPAAQNGFVTFGSMNNFSKVTPEVLALWAQLLREVPDSRLLLKAKQLEDADLRQRVLEQFREEGIAAERLTLLAALPSREDHFAQYHHLDIGLDPFPYNGTTTTCEALWMGVPVVTLAGQAHAGRVGASLLHNVGLDELVAGEPAQFLAIAKELAGDQQRLATLRGGLRADMSRSPLCDAEGFSRALAEALREAWRAWCAQPA